MSTHAPRFVVTEIRGFRRPVNGSSGREGVSFHVIDTLAARRIVGTYRSEEHRTRSGDGETVARQRAYYHAERLNDAARDDEHT